MGKLLWHNNLCINLLVSIVIQSRGTPPTSVLPHRGGGSFDRAPLQLTLLQLKDCRIPLIEFDSPKLQERRRAVLQVSFHQVAVLLDVTEGFEAGDLFWIQFFAAWRRDRFEFELAQLRQ